MKPLLLVMLLASTPAFADDAAVLTCRNLKDPALRLACYDGISVAAKPLAKATEPASPAAIKAAEQSFGQPQKAVINAIESTIPGKFEGWEPNQQFTLANGQVWKIVDGSSAYFVGNDVKVRIEKGSFSAMFMKIEGSTQYPTVRRVK
ncbi:hypothetical protein [Massilia sp. CF038]|uniref:hypothetical protein n=1 Tax=Massilia sp. CF038 TaxID=1881045 RepID=UPI00091C07DD|nr:hypothetical protein [Massilia sp. CF038]SHH17790.1 hypothetical protein SAMN05428948_3167 [Massilia sp. CF038]